MRLLAVGLLPVPDAYLITAGKVVKDPAGS